MLSGHDIVCLYCEPWDTPLRTSKHHLMEYFAKQNRVLYVEQPLHPFVALRRPKEFWGDLSRWRRGLWEVAENIHVLKGSYPLPYHPVSRLTSSPSVNRLNQRWFARTLASAFKTLGFKRPIFWLYYPIVAPVLDRLDPELVVVHVVDDWSAFEGTPKSYRGIEEEALRRADLVITSSAPLYEMNQALNANTHLVRHGTDVELFARAANPATPVPEDLARLPKPIVGYYGALHKLDNALMRWLAEKRPEWSFVLIGPTRGSQGADVSWARGLPNVHLPGPRPRERLANYLRGFDAVFFPFKMDAVSYSMCPIKVYECLPGGIPVVSRWIPEIDVLGDLVYSAKDAETFLAKLEEAMREPPERREARVRFAQECTWDKRIATIERFAEEALVRRLAFSATARL